MVKKENNLTERQRIFKVKRTKEGNIFVKGIVTESHQLHMFLPGVPVN
jgi:hypothetical protein